MGKRSSIEKAFRCIEDRTEVKQYEKLKRTGRYVTEKSKR